MSAWKPFENDLREAIGAVGKFSTRKECLEDIRDKLLGKNCDLEMDCSNSNTAFAQRCRRMHKKLVAKNKKVVQQSSSDSSSSGGEESGESGEQSRSKLRGTSPRPGCPGAPPKVFRIATPVVSPKDTATNHRTWAVSAADLGINAKSWLFSPPSCGLGGYVFGALAFLAILLPLAAVVARRFIYTLSHNTCL